MADKLESVLRCFMWWVTNGSPEAPNTFKLSYNSNGVPTVEVEGVPTGCTTRYRVQRTLRPLESLTEMLEQCWTELQSHYLREREAKQSAK